MALDLAMRNRAAGLTDPEKGKKLVIEMFPHLKIILSIQYDAEDEDDDSDVPSDLIVLGLPYKATQEEVR